MELFRGLARIRERAPRVHEYLHPAIYFSRPPGSHADGLPVLDRFDAQLEAIGEKARVISVTLRQSGHLLHLFWLFKASLNCLPQGLGISGRQQIPGAAILNDLLYSSGGKSYDWPTKELSFDYRSAKRFWCN